LREPSVVSAEGRGDALAAAAIALSLFVTYALGACRSIYVGDSGELVTAVYLLGIPHPSGYPLYVLLGKIWTLLFPLGSIAFRMSLFSAAAASAACGALYFLCRRLALSRVASLFGALLLAFSPSFWGEANIQRTYALNALFLVAATIAALRWFESRSHGALALAFLVSGIGASVHLFMAVFALALGLVIVLVTPSLRRKITSALVAGAAFLPGLLPYLYLPLRSRADPALDWGNPETLHNFLRVVFREDFWERRWIETPRDLLAIGWDYLRSFGPELGYIGALLAAIGIVALARRNAFVLLPLLVMAANVGTMALHGSRADLFIWHRYYVPSYAMATVLAAAGCQVLFDHLPRRSSFVALLVPLALLVSGWREFDRSRYRIAEDFSGTVLQSLPPGAHLIASDDNILFTMIYLHFVEGMRPDVDLILQGVGSADLPPLKFNPDTDPVFLTHHPNWNIPELRLVPVGLTFRAWRAGAPDPPLLLPGARLDGEDDPRVPKEYLTQNLIGQFHYMLGVTFEERDWPKARREFEMATAASPENDVLFFNLGLIYRRNGLLDASLAAFERSRAINPRHLASASRPTAAAKIEEATAERVRIRRIEAALAASPEMEGVTDRSPEYHLRMAALLEERGESAAARGHRLRSLR
jgi:tetratricopeptide (TPR) repeat protein